VTVAVLLCSVGRYNADFQRRRRWWWTVG